MSNFSRPQWFRLYLVPFIISHGMQVAKVCNFRPALGPVLALTSRKARGILTAFDMVTFNPPNCSIVVLTISRQSFTTPASYIQKDQLMPTPPN